MRIWFKQKGDFKNTSNFFKQALSADYLAAFNRFGQDGVRLLEMATPIDTGETASAWIYKIKRTRRGVALSWHNTNVVNGVPIAIILQYGHATRNGGYVQGRDYINPAIQPLFDQLAKDIWREVTKL